MCIRDRLSSSLKGFTPNGTCSAVVSGSSCFTMMVKSYLQCWQAPCQVSWTSKPLLGSALSLTNVGSSTNLHPSQISNGARAIDLTVAIFSPLLSLSHIPATELLNELIPGWEAFGICLIH